jgi:hypothetical protein
MSRQAPAEANSVGNIPTYTDDAAAIEQLQAQYALKMTEINNIKREIQLRAERMNKHVANIIPDLNISGGFKAAAKNPRSDHDKVSIACGRAIGKAKGENLPKSAAKAAATEAADKTIQRWKQKGYPMTIDRKNIDSMIEAKLANVYR